MAAPPPITPRAHSAPLDSSLPITSGHLSGTLARGMVVGGANAVLVLLAPQVDPIRLLLASALLWLCWLPWEVHKRRYAGRIPGVPAISVVYFIYYGLPVFIGSVYHLGRPYDRPEVTEAVGLALVGQAVLLAGFYSPFSAFFRRLQLRTDGRPPALAAWLLGAAYATEPLSVIALFGRSGLVVQSVFAYLEPLPLLFLTALFVLYLRGSLRRSHQLLGLTLFFVHVARGLATSHLSHLMVAAVVMIFVFVRERGKLPLTGIAISALIILPFLTTKLEYRAALDARPNLSVGERLLLFVEITSSSIDREGSRFADRATETSRHRTSHLGTFAFIVNATPSRVPYWGGETYLGVVWSLVPRFVYPDKPTKNLGQRFPHRYNLLSSKNYTTSFNFPQLVEMYANFGRWGVFIGMFVLGLFYRVVDQAFNHSREGILLTPVAALIFSSLLNIESDASLVLGGIPFRATILVLAMLLVGRLAGERVALHRAGAP